MLLLQYMPYMYVNAVNADLCVVSAIVDNVIACESLVSQIHFIRLCKASVSKTKYFSLKLV